MYSKIKSEACDAPEKGAGAHQSGPEYGQSPEAQLMLPGKNVDTNLIKGDLPRMNWCHGRILYLPHSHKVLQKGRKRMDYGSLKNLLITFFPALLHHRSIP